MNDLTDVPSTVKLPTLQTLRLRDNALTAFDAVLPSLRTLYVLISIPSPPSFPTHEETVLTPQ
jgi:hypothetical protein